MTVIFVIVSRIKLHITLTLLLLSNVSSAQTADSIVTVSSVDFSGDTISARYEIVTHYWKGKEVFKQDIQFKSETEWSDSTTTISAPICFRRHPNLYTIHVKYISRKQKNIPIPLK